MYEDFYGLKERPFTLVPDPDYLYLGSQHKLARAYLEYGIKERMGFVVLTGEVGTGKTTLIKSFLREKEPPSVWASSIRLPWRPKISWIYCSRNFKFAGILAAVGRPVSRRLISSCCVACPGRTRRPGGG